MLQKIKYFLSGIKPLRSFLARIFVIIVLVGSLPSLFLRYGILATYTERAVSLRISDVQTQGRILANHLLTYKYLQDSTSEVINAELSQLAEVYNGRVLIVDQNFKVIKDTYGLSVGKIMISEEIIKCFNGENTTNYDEKNHYIEMTIPISAPVEQTNSDLPGTQQTVQGVILISVSMESNHTTWQLLNRNAVLIELALFILIVGIAGGIAYLVTRPFHHVTSEIQKLQAGHFNEKISVPEYLETERISDAFNELYARIRVLDESRDEFVSNVSHELKTPMASMKVLADSLLMQEDVPAELYREFMVDIADEIDRENKIINDLLSLVKMDKTKADLNISQTDINSLLELILKRLRPIAIKRDVEMTLECIRPVVAEVDEVKLTLAITNLVENAVKYNNEHGWVKVLLDADHQFFTVEVSDSGIGIPEDSMDHIYERFYRVDKSHSREIGGTGLGLAITRSAVLMHRGTIKAVSTVGEGTTFTVKIPLIYVK
ncbi:MAG: two-component sensor histidine kinase [Lachnospiraceae bacterium]|nr:two-component sensor histidine kinase [Lachnospiraceae bacterium]